MRTEDWNRAKDKAESWSEDLLLWVIGLPKPFTAVITIVVLILAGMGGVLIWKAL